MTLNDLGKILSPLVRRIGNLVARGTVAMVDASRKMQTLQLRLLAGETKDGVEHIEPYGYTSHPHPGAEALTLFFDGDRSHGIVVIVGDRRYRLLSLAAGEVALYDDIGQYVHLKRDGIVMHSPQNILLRTDGILRLEGEGVEIHGNKYVQQDVHGKGQRETWVSGNAFHTDTHTVTTTSTSTEQGYAPPAVASDHPEGP